MLAAGVSPTDPIKGKRPIDILIEMYTRSPRFAECVQVMLDAGGTIGDPLLRVLRLDDDVDLRRLLAESNESIRKKLSPLCAYISCRGVLPLHICAEFNSIRCARVLMKNGADVNARPIRMQKGLEGRRRSFTL